MDRETKMPPTAKTVARATPNAPVIALASDGIGVEVETRTVLVDVVERAIGDGAVVGDVSDGMTSSLDGVASNPDVVVSSGSLVVVVGSVVVVDGVGSGNVGTWA